jgi:hypothetical protein
VALEFLAINIISEELEGGLIVISRDEMPSLWNSQVAEIVRLSPVATHNLILTARYVYPIDLS